MIRLVIPEATPSANKYVYRHWRVRQTDKKRWRLLLMAAGALVTEKAVGARRLTIERHGRRRLDVDNLVGGAKGIIDCLRELGLLLDDDDDSLQLSARNVPLLKGEKPHTVLIIEDL